MPEKPHIPFLPPTFSWDSPNLYTQYKIFKQKVDFAFKGLYKDNDAASKVCAILNWLGNNAYEIYEHLHWAADDDKDDPEKVFLAFENYFKPEQNQFHSWYTLGTIYSSQFKCQHNFLMRLREVAKDCSFANADEIVCFLFLTHNQNTRVREELLKTMKPTDSLHDALKITRLAEGTIYSEELLKQYLDTVKKDTTTTSPNETRARVMVKVNDIVQTVASEDLRLEEIVTIVGPNTHLRGVQHMAKNVIIVKRRDITPNVVAPELDPSLHIVSLERSSMTWSRNPMVLVNTLNLNKTVSR